MLFTTKKKKMTENTDKPDRQEKMPTKDLFVIDSPCFFLVAIINLCHDYHNNGYSRLPARLIGSDSFMAQLNQRLSALAAQLSYLYWCSKIHGFYH